MRKNQLENEKVTDIDREREVKRERQRRKEQSGKVR